jgi:hypothetical protein
MPLESRVDFGRFLGIPPPGVKMGVRRHAQFSGGHRITAEQLPKFYALKRGA